MATALDDRLVPRVLDIIDRFGTLATFMYGGTYTYTPATSTGTTTGQSTFQRKITPLSPLIQGFLGGTQTFERNASSEGIQLGEAKTYVAAKDLPFVPAVEMRVVVGTITWTVIRVLPISSGDLVAAYELHLRK